MSVLASVLADARRIPFDVAGIEGRAGERRREEKDQPLVTLDEMRLHGGHGSRRVGRLGGARDHPPRLGDRIDPALRVHDGSERRPVVEVGAAVPPSVPAMLLEGSLEGPHVLAPRGGAPLVAAILGHRREALEGGMEKPPEPDALAAPGRADPVHPVVPVARADQGKAVRADGKGPVEGPRAVLEERGPLRGHGGLEVRFHLTRGKDRSVEEGHDLIQNSAVARRFHVVDDGVRQPYGIVGDSRPDAPTRGRVPPVLHVPLHELPGRRPEQMLARHLGAGSRESHHILELIAESIGAAGLIARRARPHPAGEGLIEQPAVEQDVHRSIGSPHLHRAEDVVPSLGDGSQDRVEIGRPVPSDQRRRLVGTRLLPEEEHDLGSPSRAQLDHGLEGAAGVEGGADPPRQSDASLEARRLFQRAVAPEELRPVPRPRRLRAAEIGKAYAAAKIDVPGVAREHRSRGGVDAGDDEGRGIAARHAEHPFDIGGNGEPAGAPRLVDHRETTHLDRVLEGNELQELEGDAVGDVLESAVALSMPDDVGLPGLTNRKRGGAPEIARLLIADVDRLARRIADRIVRPGGELVLTAVERPRVSRARLGDLEAEAGIGDHVDPGRRRLPFRLEDRHVLPSVRGEAAEAVEELERGPRQGQGGGRLRRRLTPWQRGRGHLGSGHARDLLRQCPMAARQHRSGGGL